MHSRGSLFCTLDRYSSEDFAGVLSLIFRRSNKGATEGMITTTHLKIWTIVILAVSTIKAGAQPDFGYFTRNGDSDQHWVPGVADKLTDADKERFKKVKGEMNRYVFNGVRSTLVSFLDHVNKNPDSRCSDVYSGGQHSQLRCDYGQPQRSKSFGGLTSYDVNGVLDKNVITIEEAHAEDRQRIKERNERYISNMNSTSKSSNNLQRTKTVNGYTSSSSSSNSGVYRIPSSQKSSYGSYISKHIAPGSRSSRRPDMLVFSNGNSPVVNTPTSDGSGLSFTPSKADQSDSE